MVFDINNNVHYHLQVEVNENTITVNGSHDICSFAEILRPLTKENTGLFLVLFAVGMRANLRIHLH